MIGTLLLILSLTLVLSAVGWYRPEERLRAADLLFWAGALLSVFLLVAYAVADFFTGEGVNDAVIFHLRYGLKGAGFAEYGALIYGAVALLVLFGLLSGWLIWRPRQSGHSRRSHFSTIALAVSLVVNPAVVDVVRLWWQSGSADSATADEPSSAFEDYFAVPEISELQDAGKKNLVFVYGEGLERTYFDEAGFPGLMQHLRRIEEQGTSFTNVRQAVATGWTIGGIVASQCGIPLFTPSDGNSMGGMDQFLPSAVCLGDLLDEKGFDLSYMGGARVEFAGKAKFFATHGFSEAVGLEELQPELEDGGYVNPWGLYDDSLMELAYERFVELSIAPNPFALFLLTLDTHPPHGHPSASCAGVHYGDGENRMLNAVACSDLVVSEFIQRILDSPFAAETVVVLASDHLAMRNDASDILETLERRNLFVVIDPEVKGPDEVPQLGSHLDIASTVLPYLGFAADVGLGRDLRAAGPRADARARTVLESIRQWREPLMEFWDFPRIEDRLRIDPSGGTLDVDARSFKLPVLLEVDSQMKITALRFKGLNRARNNRDLVGFVPLVESGTGFVLVDDCVLVMGLTTVSVPKDGICVAAGQGGHVRSVVTLNETPVSYDVGQLRHLLAGGE